MSESVQEFLRGTPVQQEVYFQMATIGGNNYHQMMNNAAKAGAKTVVGQGLGAGVSKQVKTQSKAKETPASKETVSPELAKALESAKAQDDSQAAMHDVKDNAAQANAKKKDIGGGDDENDVRGRDVDRPKPGFVFVEGEEGEKYQIKEADANKVARMDGKSFSEKLNSDMPDGTRRASEATLNNQIESKGTEEVSKMKEGDSKFNTAIEGMDLEPAEDFMAAGSTPAPIKSPKDEKPMMVEDEHAENLAKEAAKQQLAAGGGSEAFVA